MVGRSIWISLVPERSSRLYPPEQIAVINKQIRSAVKGELDGFPMHLLQVNGPDGFRLYLGGEIGSSKIRKRLFTIDKPSMWGVRTFQPMLTKAERFFRSVAGIIETRPKGSTFAIKCLDPAYEFQIDGSKDVTRLLPHDPDQLRRLKNMKPKRPRRLISPRTHRGIRSDWKRSKESPRLDRIKSLEKFYEAIKSPGEPQAKGHRLEKWAKTQDYAKLH